jgi:hypothetical protein
MQLSQPGQYMDTVCAPWAIVPPCVCQSVYLAVRLARSLAHLSPSLPTRRLLSHLAPAHPVRSMYPGRPAGQPLDTSRLPLPSARLLCLFLFARSSSSTRFPALPCLPVMLLPIALLGVPGSSMQL